MSVLTRPHISLPIANYDLRIDMALRIMPMLPFLYYCWLIDISRTKNGVLYI